MKKKRMRGMVARFGFVVAGRMTIVRERRVERVMERVRRVRGVIRKELWSPWWVGRR